MSSPARYFELNVLLALGRIETRLKRTEEMLKMADKNLDQIVADWPALQTAVGSALTKITELSGQLAGLNADDPRAADLHNQITTLTASVNAALAPVGGNSSVASAQTVATGSATPTGASTASSPAAGSPGAAGQAAQSAAGLQSVPPNV